MSSERQFAVVRIASGKLFLLARVPRAGCGPKYLSYIAMTDVAGTMYWSGMMTGGGAGRLLKQGTLVVDWQDKCPIASK